MRFTIRNNNVRIRSHNRLDNNSHAGAYINVSQPNKHNPHADKKNFRDKLFFKRARLPRTPAGTRAMFGGGRRRRQRQRNGQNKRVSARRRSFWSESCAKWPRQTHSRRRRRVRNWPQGYMLAVELETFLFAASDCRFFVVVVCVACLLVVGRFALVYLWVTFGRALCVCA